MVLFPSKNLIRIPQHLNICTLRINKFNINEMQNKKNKRNKWNKVLNILGK